MKNTTRPVAAAAALVLTGLLAACSGDPGSGSTPSDDGGSTSEAPQDNASGISNPKNVQGADPCELLPPEALKSLGMGPEGERQENLFDSNIPDRCAWKSPDGGNSISVTPFPDRSIESYYQKPQEFKDFAKLEVAGYPAVRATKGDPEAEGSCAIYVAPREGQLLGADTILHDASSDPCEKSKQALAAALEKLPAAK